MLKINIWSEIKSAIPIWFFDATGNVIKERKIDNLICLYSFVMHDADRKIILPVAEFVTTCHDGINISNNLHRIRRYFLTNKRGPNGDKIYNIAPIIVTDQAMALINSVIEAFNQCEFLDYLQWCFDRVFKKTKRSLSTRIIICNIHMLKSILKATKKTKANQTIQDIFFFCLVKIQNCREIEVLDRLIRCMFVIFCKKKRDKYFNDCLNMFKKDASTESLESMNEKNGNFFYNFKQ